MKTGSWSLLLVAMLAGCEPVAETAPPTPQRVRAVPVREATLPQALSFYGVLQPVERAQLAFQSPGIVMARPAQLGRQVRRGELLATLDNPDLGPAQKAASARLQELLAQRDQTRRELDRLQALYLSGAVGKELVEQKDSALAAVEASVRRARADLSGSRQRLQDATLLAPFDGVVYQINAEPGEFVTAGQAIMSLGGTDRVEVTVRLPVAVVDGLQPGAPLRVSFPQTDGLELPGRVSEVASIGEVHSGLFPVVVEIDIAADSAPVRAGMRAEVRVIQGSAFGLVMPLSAVVDPVGGDPRIFVIENEVVRLYPVAIDLVSAGQVLLHLRESAASVGDKLVVIAGHRNLVDGQAVRLVP